MKTNFLKRAATLLLSAGLILTTACSDDVPGGENGGKNPEGEVGYLSFSFINSSQRGGTKAGIPENKTDYGTEAENKVNEVLVLLYGKNESGTTVVKDKIYLKNIGTVGALGSDVVEIKPGINATTYKIKAQVVIKDDYKMAVFVNPSAKIKADAISKEGVALTDLEAAAAVDVSELTGTADSPNFLMSNFNGLKDVAKADIKETAEDAEAAPVFLHVERAVAKVQLALDEGFATSTKLAASVSNILWDVDIVNKKTFWMRKAALMISPDLGENYPLTTAMQATGLIDEIVTDQDGTVTINAKPTNRYLMYATDPNMTTGNDDIGEYNENDKTGNFIYASKTQYAPDASIYVTENTMNAAAQIEKATTSVLISAIITPNKTFFGETLTAHKDAVEGDGGSDAVVSSPYFLYNNMAFTPADITEILAVYQVNSEGNISYDGTKTITSAKKEDDSGSYTWSELTAKGTNDAISSLPTILATIATGESGVDYTYFSSLNTTGASKDMASGNAVVRYFAPDAPNYYYVPIRHFEDGLQADAMTYGRYGVVRNNFYKLTLTGINRYGYAEIPDPDDRDDKDDKESSWLSVQFEILSWMERNQNIGL